MEYSEKINCLVFKIMLKTCIESDIIHNLKYINIRGQYNIIQ